MFREVSRTTSVSLSNISEIELNFAKIQFLDRQHVIKYFLGFQALPIQSGPVVYQHSIIQFGRRFSVISHAAESAPPAPALRKHLRIRMQVGDRAVGHPSGDAAAVLRCAGAFPGEMLLGHLGKEEEEEKGC